MKGRVTYEVWQERDGQQLRRNTELEDTTARQVVDYLTKQEAEYASEDGSEVDVRYFVVRATTILQEVVR